MIDNSKSFPSDWKLNKISEFSDVVTGGTPNTKNPEYFNGDVKWLKSGDINGLYIYDTSEKISKLGLNNSAAKLHPPGGVAIALSGRGKTRGMTAIIKAEMSCSQSVAIIYPKLNMIPDYLHYRLKQDYLKIRNLTGDLSRSGLNIGLIEDIRIPIPPLVEQFGIVEVLGTVDECIRLTDAVIERAEELKRGLMQQLLTRGIGHTEYKETPLGEIPKTWKTVSLGDPSISKIIMGQSPPSSSYNSKGDGLPFLQGNAEFGYKFPKTILYTTKPQKIAQENDILVSVRAPVGELNYTPYRLCIGRGLSAIRVNPKNLSIDFIYYYLKQNINRLHALSTGSTFKAIRKEELFSFKLPIPNIVEQHHINKILNNVNDKILHEKEKQKYFIKMIQGLMQLLLSGKIRVELKGDGLHRIRDGREANN